MPNRDSTSAPLNFDPEHQGIFHPTKIVVTTGFELPGYEITEILGPVFGVIVRSRNIGATMGAAFKSFVGGELRALTKNVEMSREVTMDRMVGAAMGKGAQGIIAFRFDASGSEGVAEVCCYGTAVKARRLAPPTNESSSRGSIQGTGAGAGAGAFREGA